MNQYFLLLLPITVVIAWIVLFVMTGRYRQLHDKLILAFLTCSGMTCYVAIRSLVEGASDYAFVLFDNLETLVALSICPLLFLYIRTIARSAHWQLWYWLLFVPALVLCITDTALSFAVGWDRILEVRQYGMEPFRPALVDDREYLYQCVNITLFNTTLEIMSAVLIGLSAYLLVMYYRRAANYYANLEDSAVSKMHNFLISAILLLITIFSLVYFIPEIVTCDRRLLIAIALWLTLLAWCIGYNAYRITLSPQHYEFLADIDVGDLQIAEGRDAPVTATPHLIGRDEVGKKVVQWEQRTDKPYCKDGLTVSDVAKAMNISARTLSVYINQHRGMNFNRWINTLRIDEAKRMLCTCSDVKIGAIALDLGFTDQAAFTNVFRSLVGCTPQAYRETAP